MTLDGKTEKAFKYRKRVALNWGVLELHHVTIKGITFHPVMSEADSHYHDGGTTKSQSFPGAILNFGQLLICHTRFENLRILEGNTDQNSRGAAITNGNFADIRHSEFVNNRVYQKGGAIWNHGPMAISDTKFTGCRSDFGG